MIFIFCFHIKQCAHKGIYIKCAKKISETTIKPKKKKKTPSTRGEKIKLRIQNEKITQKIANLSLPWNNFVYFFFLPFLFIPTCLLIVQVFVMNTKICGFVLNMNILKRNSYMVPWMGFVWNFLCWMLLLVILGHLLGSKESTGGLADF